ncbi:MAG: hypothetical protein Kow0047_08650 [Anaerolineae bacterium]
MKSKGAEDVSASARFDPLGWPTVVLSTTHSRPAVQLWDIGGRATRRAGSAWPASGLTTRTSDAP